MRSRSWCFTLNNYTAEDCENVSRISDGRYVVFGKEVGESGTPHLQGYVYFDNKKSLAQLKKCLPTAHFEIARGTFAQNYAYCTKDGNFEEYGKKPLDKGERLQAANTVRMENIAECWEKAKKGDFLVLPPTHIRTWEYIRNRYGDKPKDLTVLANFWFHGASGVGKSHSIRQCLDMSKVFSKPLSSWWDNYAQEPIVLIEDYDPGHTKMFGHWMKIWCDHYAFNAQVKGSYYFIRPKVLIVTSQYSLADCFPASESQETFDAVNRRFGGANTRHFKQVSNVGLQFNVTASNNAEYKAILTDIMPLIQSDDV